MAKFERFQHKGCLEELRVKSVIWSVDFNNYHPSCYGANVFSYLYENFAVICYFEGEGDNHKVKVLQRYEIPDDEDHLYASCWVGSEIILAVGGKRGVVHLIYCSKTNEITNNNNQKPFATLVGHGDQIYDLKSTTSDRNLLVSCSADYSIRVWDIEMQLCVMILAGDKGHLAPVLSIDINDNGKKIVSSGMDNAVRIWNIENELEMWETRKKSIKELQADPLILDPNLPDDQQYSILRKQRTKSMIKGEVIRKHYPEFSSQRIHRNYIDCVKFFDDNLIFSKSVQPVINLWTKDSLLPHRPHRKAETISILSSFTYSQIDTDIWFTHFCLDPSHRFLVAGNGVGNIFYWDLYNDMAVKPGHQLIITSVQDQIRHFSFNQNSTIMLYVTDGGQIGRVNIRIPPEEESYMDGINVTN